MSLPQTSFTNQGSGIEDRRPAGSAAPAHDPRPLTADDVAHRINQAGMGDVATLLLHTFKPLAWVGGQVAWILQPFVDGLGRQNHSPLSVSGLAQILEREGGVDEIIERLRTLQREGDG